MRKFFAFALALTLSFAIVSCSNSDDSIIRVEENIKLYPGIWETDMVTYNIPGIHAGTHKFSVMATYFGEEFFAKETLEIVSENEIILKQYKGDGQLVGPFVGKLENGYFVFGNGLQNRKVSKSNEYEFTLNYDMTFYGRTEEVQVTHVRPIEE